MTTIDCKLHDYAAGNIVVARLELIENLTAGSIATATLTTGTARPERRAWLESENISPDRNYGL